MGAEPIDALRQMKNTATDPYSGGRNFAGHYSRREWNVAPVSSPIEVQYSIAPGTALAQKRHGGDGITIVTGGDAGTAEGDFATLPRSGARARATSSRADHRHQQPVGHLHRDGRQHGETRIADRGKAFGIQTQDHRRQRSRESPTASSQEAMEYVRKRAQALPAGGAGLAPLRALARRRAPTS